MEPIDAAARRMTAMASEVAKSGKIASESDTRLKVIDRILIEVLGWSRSEIDTEETAGKGFVDYKLSVGGLARLVVEAKKDDRDFEFASDYSGRSFILDGPVFKNKHVQEGIEQAIRYCAHKNAELACVTNGRQWVVLRGSRLGDGRDTLKGQAFVFGSLEGVLEKFRIFFELLSHDAVAGVRYRALFQEAEGQPARASLFRKALRHPDSPKLLPQSKLGADLDRVMVSFFRNLTGDDDPDLITECFVTTKESDEADRKLARISEDLLSRLRDLDTFHGAELTSAIRRVKATQRNEFILIVGTKGAGKSTFISRFFKRVLPRDLVSGVIEIRVDLASSEGNEQTILTWLDQHLVPECEQALFAGTPSYEDLQGMYYDEYNRWRSGTYRPLYEQDKDSFKIEFGKHIEQRREQRPHQYLGRMLEHVVRSRKRVPCLVLDNADHFNVEFQERVFQYARSIYEESLCLILMPITDKTSWQLSRQGAIESFFCESLFLPTPSPQQVLKKRIEYLEKKLGEQTGERGTGYFLNRGISLELGDLRAFANCLQSVFIRTGRIAEWIGNLANRDIRRCLDLARDLIGSPYIQADELLKAYVGKTAMTVRDVELKKALIRGKYDVYPVGRHKFVQNIFALQTEPDTSPLLGLRLLQYLRDAQHQEVDGQVTFVEVERVVDYMNSMGLASRATLAWLEAMLRTGLVLGKDPTASTLASAKQIELSPAGLQHWIWGCRDRIYVESMLMVTPILERNVYRDISDANERGGSEAWKATRGMFVQYLTAEDRRYCQPPDHEHYGAQRQLCETLQRELH